MSTNDKMLAVIILIMIEITCALLQGKQAGASITLCLSCPQRPGTVAAWDVGYSGYRYVWDVRTRAATGRSGLHVGTWREDHAPESGHWLDIEIQ